MITTRFVVVLLVAAVIPACVGHSYVTTPITRGNQRETNTGCRGPSCLGPCELKKAQATRAPIQIQRGQSISVQWPRNNHAGGFIRFSWAPFDQSDSQAAFDANIQSFVCHERGCAPGDAGNPNGGDSGPADGSTMACNAPITVPLHLTNGRWTLQWAWFGGAFALSDYYSCVDYEITGGPTASKAVAIFQGGDYTFPGQQKCKFFNTNRLGVCTNEPCLSPPLPGQQSGAPQGFSTSTGTGGSTTGSQTGSGTTTGSATGTGGSTTGTGGTSTTGTVYPGVNNTGLCPNPNAPNRDGETLYPPQCGNLAPTARCADGQCCSKFGYCGPIADVDGQYREGGVVMTYQAALALYCNDNQGDWRYVACPTSTGATPQENAQSTGSSVHSWSLVAMFVGLIASYLA